MNESFVGAAIQDNAATVPTSLATSPGASDENSTSSPSKRHKIKQACIFCRRSHMACNLERPCNRCLKRGIPNLCHDELPNIKPSPRTHAIAVASADAVPSTSQSLVGTQPSVAYVNSVATPGAAQRAPSPTQITSQRGQFSDIASNVQSGTIRTLPSVRPHTSEFADMHHSSFAFNDTEVTNEFNLLNDFLNNSLMDGAASMEDNSHYIPNPSIPTTSEPSELTAKDKKSQYYLQAADPEGNDSPEERMKRVLRAKYDADMLKPFNYANGYRRLSTYMESRFRQPSIQKILRQLDRFRPKFRELVKALTDMELIYAEMWFERSLLEYERLAASMAIPSCCWRRTGEIFRGNKEMAELLHVPIEKFRDGKLALHEVLTEDSLVNYWDKFGAIAFENQKALLTSCSLKNPDETSEEPPMKCCFSFTIKRDAYRIPALIIGNFLPQDPQKD